MPLAGLWLAVTDLRGLSIIRVDGEELVRWLLAPILPWLMFETSVSFAPSSVMSNSTVGASIAYVLSFGLEPIDGKGGVLSHSDGARHRWGKRNIIDCRLDDAGISMKERG